MTWLDTFLSATQQDLSDLEVDALMARGTSEEQIRLFQIGCIKDSLPQRIDYPPNFIEWSLRGKKVLNSFVFPLTNALGRVKGLQFRHIQRDVPGYTDWFISKDEPIYFGLAQAMPHVWESQTILLVEGVFDLFPVQRVYPFAVPTLTASVSQDFQRFLERNVVRVWLGYDSDGPGYAGARKFCELNRGKFEIRVLEFPRIKMANGNKKTKDPSDLWETLGEEGFGVCLRATFNMSKRMEMSYGKDMG